MEWQYIVANLETAHEATADLITATSKKKDFMKSSDLLESRLNDLESLYTEIGTVIESYYKGPVKKISHELKVHLMKIYLFERYNGGKYWPDKI